MAKLNWNRQSGRSTSIEFVPQAAQTIRRRERDAARVAAHRKAQHKKFEADARKGAEAAARALTLASMRTG